MFYNKNRKTFPWLFDDNFPFLVRSPQLHIQWMAKSERSENSAGDTRQSQTTSFGFVSKALAESECLGRAEPCQIHPDSREIMIAKIIDVIDNKLEWIWLEMFVLRSRFQYIARTLLLCLWYIDGKRVRKHVNNPWKYFLIVYFRPDCQRP